MKVRMLKDWNGPFKKGEILDTRSDEFHTWLCWLTDWYTNVDYDDMLIRLLDNETIEVVFPHQYKEKYKWTKCYFIFGLRVEIKKPL